MSIFLKQTIQLLRERPKHMTLALIAEEIGVTHSWLESILSERHKSIDPGVRRIETLYNYLADKPFSFEVNINIDE